MNRNDRLTNLRRAFSLIELLCVIAIIGLLIGMTLPAIQAVRESARSLSCRNNLRNFALGIAQFESAMSKLPPGTMSFEPIRTDDLLGNYYEYAENPSYQFFWKKTQNISWAAYILPFFEEASVRDQFPQEVFSWTDHVRMPIDFPPVREAISNHLAFAYCPSDNLREEIETGQVAAAVRAQPSVAISRDIQFNLGEPDGFLTEDKPVVPELSGKFGGTNYLGCCGVFSSASHPSVRPVGYSGALICGRALAMKAVIDGLSNTVLIGESLGTIHDGNRTEAYSWAFGGVARGRGHTAWLENFSMGHYFLSDSKFSYRNGFGSRHPLSVNVAFADGSVHSIHRGISVQTWYSLCGRDDGAKISLGDF
jgi:prepilin-type N-terminal cleavage/methylation domain-containing protein/prepilin-type processing-associated H-X9-DG protein